VSYDLAVLAMEEEAADPSTAREMYERCVMSGEHLDGELDQRVVGFYERLRGEFPDHGPVTAESPWMSTPLDAGTDHVAMSLNYSRSDEALAAIERLAQEFRLVIWDPQAGEAYFPRAMQG
jgi:hypothetical protein